MQPGPKTRKTFFICWIISLIICYKKNMVKSGSSRGMKLTSTSAREKEWFCSAAAFTECFWQCGLRRCFRGKSLNFYKYLKAVEISLSKVWNRLTLNLRKCLELTEARIKTRYDPNWNSKYNANKLDVEEDKYAYSAKLDKY